MKNGISIASSSTRPNTTTTTVSQRPEPVCWTNDELVKVLESTAEQ